ncbi:hypothetical protein L1987_85596 [Smallanthus sonchifolius]|uniref:Uncharacterized protein n=1 Tax=Smallanthus sonchifolius TaxID=185202 RepID=A0ACB8XY80_9ASTR|nr:hypothetical protein L1987_85596 [Smallanthus sonchifolius]
MWVQISCITAYCLCYPTLERACAPIVIDSSIRLLPQGWHQSGTIINGEPNGPVSEEHKGNKPAKSS